LNFSNPEKAYIFLFGSIILLLTVILCIMYYMFIYIYEHISFSQRLCILYFVLNCYHNLSSEWMIHYLTYANKTIGFYHSILMAPENQPLNWSEFIHMLAEHEFNTIDINIFYSCFFTRHITLYIILFDRFNLSTKVV
jgi:hypothetical protein